jgi:hypothetical protein
MTVKKPKSKPTNKSNRPKIPEWTTALLWAKSAGRCNLCNKPAYEDSLTFDQINLSERAHIIGSSSNGPRGDVQLSEELAVDIENLMLMCKEHARSIDKMTEKYPVDLLRKIKQEHENKVFITTSIPNGDRSHLLTYGSKVSNQNNPINFDDCKRAMFLEGVYPAESTPTSIHLTGSILSDKESSFWDIERRSLKVNLNVILQRIEQREISRLSIFALTAIPLLIELGSLLTDKSNVDVYQLHREPKGWSWSKEEDINFRYITEEPNNTLSPNVALILSFSGSIAKKDIFDSMGCDSAIWEMTIPEPGNDFMKSLNQLSLFRKEFRKILNRIKEVHGSNTVINLFPAVPVSVAVEIGRTWMPKADIPIMIWDRNRYDGQLLFKKIFKIGE